VAWGRWPTAGRIESLYDNAVRFVMDGPLTWQDFWQTTQGERDRITRACNRRAAEIERSRRG
jgi:hypothetical protein